VQTNQGAAQLNTRTAYVFTATVVMNDSNTVGSATVTTPWGATLPLQYHGDGKTWLFRDGCDDQTSVDAVYPDGNYTLSISTAHDGLKNLPLGISGSSYPNAPHITNYTAVQVIDPARSFTLQWDPFQGGTTNDFVYFEMAANGVTVVNTKSFGKSSALDGTSLSSKISSGILSSGIPYEGRLSFEKILSTNDQSYPGALGHSGNFSRTIFNMLTLGPGNPPVFTSTAIDTQNNIHLGFAGVVGLPYTIQISSNLLDWSLGPTLSATNTETLWIDSGAGVDPKRFYRIFLNR
jgi:hypothetical protein